MNGLSEEEINKVRALLEHEGLYEFLPYVEQAAAEQKLSAARRLLWKQYRQLIIGLAGLLGALVMISEGFRAVIKSIWTGVIGV